MNRILRVDLSSRTWTTEELDEKLIRITLEAGDSEQNCCMMT